MAKNFSWNEWEGWPPARREVPALSPAPEPHHIETRLCVKCRMQTLIPLCWYLFRFDHRDTPYETACSHRCDIFVCYVCKVRARNELWYKAEDNEHVMEFSKYWEKKYADSPE